MEYDKRSRKTDGRPIPSRSHLRLGSSSPIDCNIPQLMAVKKEEIIRKWWSSIATRGCICYCYHYYYYSYYYILLYIYIYISSYIIYIYTLWGFPWFPLFSSVESKVSLTAKTVDFKLPTGPMGSSVCLPAWWFQPTIVLN